MRPSCIRRTQSEGSPLLRFAKTGCIRNPLPCTSMSSPFLPNASRLHSVPCRSNLLAACLREFPLWMNLRAVSHRLPDGNLRASFLGKNFTSAIRLGNAHGEFPSARLGRCARPFLIRRSHNPLGFPCVNRSGFAATILTMRCVLWTCFSTAADLALACGDRPEQLSRSR